MRRAGRHTFSQTMPVNESAQRNANRYAGSIRSAEGLAEGLRQFEPVLSMIPESRRDLWTKRLLERPDPESWRGKISGRMMRDWDHASERVGRETARDSMDRAGAIGIQASIRRQARLLANES
jgi:hypothetical protein